MKLSELFTIKYGQHEINNKENLDRGNNIVISSQSLDNGCYGFFETSNKYTPPVITVPRTGSIGYAFVQLYKCNIDDNVLVLKPINEYSKEYLYYICVVIRALKWRYSYGRLITPKRLGAVEVVEPNKFKTDVKYESILSKHYPNSSITGNKKIKISDKKEFNITDIFVVQRGHFHSIEELETGNLPTISRVSTDNGLVGFYKKPVKAKIFNEPFITISTVTGDAFVQVTKFIATDNVLILKPKNKLKIETLFFIQALLNNTRWRYSYGRQPYKRIFEKTTILLPNKGNEIDEDKIKQLFDDQVYWSHYKKRYLN